MNKILLSISILLLAQLSFAGHHEESEKATATIIGYEKSDEGEKLDIIAGDISVIDIWVKYVEAHNIRDLEAINRMNAADFEGRAANGVIVKGTEAHSAFLKKWFATSNPSWEYSYAIANDVPQKDGTIHHWVTSSYTLTDIIDGKEVVSEDFFDVRIENGKIKYIFVASRAVITEEE
ncbi:MAG: hypothetical protein HOH08_04955 [Gammaproteobacteria bacterium]|nr:hypothetical protein [Gammaproteobacteria bacterium]MBT6074281.1 hypothetical protein [Gammaproteobacteria bacterium]